jgi:UDP-N-acetylglucosamine 3-dehydrogenase
MKLSVAVIGTGKMGINHVRTYAAIKNVDLVAVSDLNRRLGKKVAEEFNVNYYEDYNQMLRKEKPTLVSVCVPTKYHFRVAQDVIKKKINILLEKPITLNVNEAQKLLKLSRKYSIKFLVGHIERFNPAVRKVKEMVANGELGDIIAIAARRVGGFPPQITDANIAVDLSIHDIDIANYLLNELPRKIVVNKRRNHILKREDSVEFFLKYKKASAYLQANWITPVKIRKLTITGKEGYLEMDYLNQEILFYKSNYRKFKKRFKNFSDYILQFSEPDKTVIRVKKKEPLKEEILYFINCVKYNTEIDSQFALNALKIALA